MNKKTKDTSEEIYKEMKDNRAILNEAKYAVVLDFAYTISNEITNSEGDIVNCYEDLFKLNEIYKMIETQLNIVHEIDKYWRGQIKNE